MGPRRPSTLAFVRKAAWGHEGKRVKKIDAGTESLYPDAEAEIDVVIDF